MHFIFISILSTLITINGEIISGPFVFWGHENVVNLQPRALIEANEKDFTNLYNNAKSIVIFIRNTTNRLERAAYPKTQELIKNNIWTYLPQRTLAIEPIDNNENIKIVNLNGFSEEDDAEIVSNYQNAISLYGNGKILSILAYPAEDNEDDLHLIAKRAAKNEDERTTTAIPAVEETDASFIYVADGRKAVLYVNSAPILNISNAKESIKLLEHNKAITFDDQKSKGYGRLNIIFNVDGDKLFLRFNFTLEHGTWYMKAVEVEYKELKTVLPSVGGIYEIPSAPVGFSYRCSAQKMIFRNNNSDSLVLNDYQVQPWLNGAAKFGNVYDCVGFTSVPILAGILVTFFLIGILSIGLVALLEIKTPNRFESSRNKQLAFTVQD